MLRCERQITTFFCRHVNNLMIHCCMSYVSSHYIICKVLLRIKHYFQNEKHHLRCGIILDSLEMMSNSTLLCNLCRTTLSAPTSNTTNLFNNLNFNHSAIQGVSQPEGKSTKSCENCYTDTHHGIIVQCFPITGRFPKASGDMQRSPISLQKTWCQLIHFFHIFAFNFYLKNKCLYCLTL